jgi:pimeloyl-ACP methyl ester carboxylesterase
MTAYLDDPVLSQRLFFPRRAFLSDPLWVDCGDARLACALVAPHAGALTVVHFHGNGETVADGLGLLAAPFTALGVNVLFASYRGYGLSSGEPALVSMLADVPRIVEAAGLDPERTVFFGRSLGSLYALHAVSCFPDAAGLVLESGIADVLERVLVRLDPEEVGASLEEIEAEVSASFDHRAKLAGYPGPVLVLHTRHDGLIDVSHAERLHGWAGERSRLRVFGAGDHNSILGDNWGEYWGEVGGLVGRLPGRGAV